MPELVGQLVIKILAHEHRPLIAVEYPATGRFDLRREAREFLYARIIGGRGFSHSRG